MTKLAAPTCARRLQHRPVQRPGQSDRQQVHFALGTVARIDARLREAASGKSWSGGLHVAANPEFLKEGCAFEGCMRPEQIIVGSAGSFGAAGALLSSLAGPAPE